MSEIHLAVEESDLAKVEQLAKTNRTNLELPDGLGNHPLHLAAQNNQADVAKLLLQLGADVNSCGDMNRTPLHFASLNGAKEVAELLVKSGAELEPIDAHAFTPLYYSVQGGGDGSGIDKVLLKLGLPVDLNSAVWLLDAAGLRKMLIAHPKRVEMAANPTQLVGDAIIRGDADVVAVLIDFGAPINGAPSFRPLILALPRPHLVRLLLERGADVTGTDSFGEDAITKAKNSGSSNDVLHLLERYKSTH